MKLLALVESPDHVCCRYRIRAFAAALADAGWTLTCQGLERGAFFRPLQLRRAAEFDAVILQRKLLPTWQLYLLRRAARHLVFDFDDAVLYRDSYDARGLHSAGALVDSHKRSVWPIRSSPATISWRIVPCGPGRRWSAFT